MDDISLMINDIKFNFRVAAIIKHNNKVLLHKSREDDFYAIPGGRIKIGEDSESALKREMIEEINANININKFLGFIENFFNYNNKSYHEIMLLYKVSFIDKKFYKTDIINGLEDNSKIHFVWKNIEDLEELDIKPSNIKKILINNNESFFHLIENS